MRFDRFDAPHIRHHESALRVTLHVIVTLSFLYGLALFYYGPRALLLGCCSVLTAVAADILCTKIARRKLNPRDLSAVITGMLLPLMMPASIDYSIVVIAALFAIMVTKHPFGGTGYNVFNPAAAGFSFAAICFSDKMFLYPKPMNWLPLGSAADAVTVNSPAFTLSLGGLPQYDLLDMMLGNFPGPMGATNILVIAACLLYLILRNVVRWETPVFFLATAGLFSMLFCRGGAELGLGFTMRLQLTLFELMSGFILFGCVFLLGDPVTTPTRSRVRMVFATVCGVVVMLFRWFGGFDEPFTFALLLMNTAVFAFDILGERAVHKRRQLQLQQSEKEQIPS